MDYAALKAEILANPACAPYINDGTDPARKATYRDDDAQVAAIISAGRKEVRPRMISERGILSDYAGGPVAADAVLTKLETFSTSGQPLSSVVARAIKFMAQPDGIDVGAVATRTLIDQLSVTGVLTTEEARHLKALAEHDAPVTPADVSRALRGPWE